VGIVPRRSPEGADLDIIQESGKRISSGKVEKFAIA